jgi:Uma2 family endonuclease
MVTMTSSAWELPWSRSLTAGDLEELPDDGHRYELVDGTLVVTPWPAVPHQRAVGRMFSALTRACPPELEVMPAPLDIRVCDDTVLQPDLLVATREALSGRRLVGAPLLAIEVLSPSTRLLDLNLKRAAFERAGVASYWVVETDPPSIAAWDLVGGAYVDRAGATGAELFEAQVPFAFRLAPGDLAT